MCCVRHCVLLIVCTLIADPDVSLSYCFEKTQRCGFNITEVNMNFTAEWNPCKYRNSTYRLIRSRGNVLLCETNATSCFLGGSILENTNIFSTLFRVVTLEFDGQKCMQILNSDYKAGPPDVLSTDIHARNITLHIRGAQTPLFTTGDGMYRGPSWTGEKTPLFMGQDGTGMRLSCMFTIINATGGIMQKVKGTLSDNSGQGEVEFTKLSPYSNYTVELRCETDESKVIKFTTSPEVPASGPSVLKLHSLGLGCDKRDKRDITFTIEPPPSSDHNGILTWYDIHYHTVTSDQSVVEWQSLVQPITYPVPPVTEVVLHGLSRWDPVEIVVFANNSKGGAGSSVRQINKLAPSDAESHVNITKSKVEPDTWLLEWLPPWPSDTGDCVLHYVVSTEDKQLAEVNSTSYIVDSTQLGPGGEIKVTPVLYNGNGPYISGVPETVVLGSSSPQRKVTFIIMEVTVGVLVLLSLVLVCVFVRFGPRWTHSIDLSSNAVLKTALAMGELRPKARREREEYDEIVKVCPDPAGDVSDETESVALIEIENPPVAEQAEARPIAGNRPLAPSEKGCSTAECSCIDTCIPERGSDALSPSSSCDDSSGVLSSSEGKCEKTTICSEDSLNVLTHSCTDSGYVQSPPPPLHPVQTQLLCNPQTLSTYGYYRMDQIINSVGQVTLDKGPGYSEYKLDQRGHQAGCLLVFNNEMDTEECSCDDIRTPAPDKQADLGHTLIHSSLDSESTGSSLYTSDHETGDGVECYTKLSCPNTTLPPGNNLDKVQLVDAQTEGTDTSLQQFLSQLSNVPLGLPHIGYGT